MLALRDEPEAKTLRPYQEEAIKAVYRRYNAGDRSTLLVSATGTGKTFMVSHMISDAVSRGVRVLTIAHREELIEQARDAIMEVGGFSPLEVQVEMGKHRAGPGALVVCGSVQTMRAKRLSRWDPKSFGFIWLDEAHHAPARTYLGVLSHFHEARILGVTATPDRLDGKGLGRVFQSVAYTYELVEAINDGWLSPLKCRQIIIPSLSLASVRTRAGDFVEADLDREMCKRPSLYEVARPTIEEAKDRQTLVFATTVNHAEQLAKVMNELEPGQADYLSGRDTSDRRRDVLDAFRAGRLKRLVNCQLFTEGVDLPIVSCVAVARPTQSRALYAQMIGRGTRLFPGKENCLILDYTDNAVSHKLVCAFDILDDNDDQEARKLARKEASEREVDPMAALEAASRLLAEQERARAMEAVRYAKREIDPFSVIGFRVRKHHTAGMPPTEEQLKVLRRHKLPTEGLTKREASRLIGHVFARRAAGMCSPRQAAQLARRGLSPDLSLEDANAAMKILADNDWRTPRWMLSHPTYKPREAKR